MTAISWTDETWNPTTGCDRVSAGCDNCYALKMAKRLKAMGSAKYQRDGDPRTSGPGFGVSVHESALSIPLRWRKPRKVFVNSTSDLFHDDIPDEFIVRVWAVMAATPMHTYQVLTKRHGRMRALLTRPEFREHVLDAVVDSLDLSPDWADTVIDRVIDGAWPLPNLWLGVSAEDQKRADLRIPALLRTPAAVRWISAEPLLGPIDLTRVASGQRSDMVFDVVGNRYGVPGQWQAELGGRLDWVVCGGESGPGARPMRLDWARTLVEQCQSASIPVFVKQDSGPRPGMQGQIPDELWVKEYPDVPAGVS